MKSILVTAILLATSLSFGFGGSKVPDSVRVEPSQPVVTPQPAVQKPLAWGLDNPMWDKALREAISEANLPLTTKIPCKNTVLNECFALLAAKMTQYESSFNPKTTFLEKFKDSKGNRVLSTGLFQISIESSKQSAYKCDYIKTQADLFDPIKNIKCSVNIIAHWARKSGTLIDGSMKSAKGKYIGGCAAYWSVCRKDSGSYAKILAYLDNY